VRTASRRLAALVATALLPATAAAADAPDPGAPQALGRVFGAGPQPRSFYLLAAGGYGYTESVLGMNDAHHRAAGAIAAEARLLSWLGVAFRLDGRYDLHLVPGQPHDDGLVGDPRLYLRVDRALGAGLRIGARAGLWLPGRNAPSIDRDALSPELVGALSFVPPSRLVSLSANLGYRLDRSARSAGDAPLLTPGDRLALEVSAFDAVLLGAAASFGRGPAQGFVEASWELLVGAGHPPPLSSPIWTGAGVRVALSAQLHVEAEAEICPSNRPSVAADAPLVPVPPRYAAWVGLAYRFGASASPPPPASAAAALPTAAPPAPAVEVLLRGQVTAADGGALAETRVVIAAGGVETEVEVNVGGDGRFVFRGKPGQALQVRAEAAGCTPASRPVTLPQADGVDVALALERRLPSGQLRGLVRSLKGADVDAEILVEPGERRVRAQRGRFEVDVPPGSYEVTISAPGYETQTRRVQVEENGVTLLDVDLKVER
jgi:hypothetical protein